MMQTKMGDYDIIDSGSAVVTNNNTLKFKFDEESDVLIEFVEDEKQNQELKKRIEGPNLIISLINFNNPLGISFKEPISIGTRTDGKKIYINIAVHAIGDNANKAQLIKVVHYSWLSKPEAAK